MASPYILSQTLLSITTVKLEELSNQRSNFEEGKAELLRAVNTERDQGKKVGLLLDGIEALCASVKLNEEPTISFSSIRQFLEQAQHDPSVTTKIQKDWQVRLEKELENRSLKYEYADLYGRLVNEWLLGSKSASEKDIEASSTFEEVGRKEMHDQRVTWEEYVFKPLETDTVAIEEYLTQHFKSTKATRSAYDDLCKRTEVFQKSMTSREQFDENSLKWVINGLLRSDVVTDEKKRVLRDFLNNKVVLEEVADVLNMRMVALRKWRWDPEGTFVEQRRQLNGRYRFYHDEDLLQSILLRYIGTKWSAYFKSSLTTFRQADGVWKSPLPAITDRKRKRRDEFLHRTPHFFSVEKLRGDHYDKEIFLEQLVERVGEQRGSYGDDAEDELDTRKSGQQTTQTLLHTLGAEIIMKTRLGEELVVVRSDFKWFGPSLPHSTMFTVLKFLGVSEDWVDFLCRVLEAPMKFVQDGPDAPIQIRKRGTPISGPLSDMLGETVLFCLDFAFNRRTNGSRLYRLHDDIWFWGSEENCVVGWETMTDFSRLMGLEFNEGKTGSVKITRKGAASNLTQPSLPKGDVRWGFLKLDSETGRFLIDQEGVSVHIEELRRQLGACKSIFDWIQAWNVYGARFFTNNFGKPASCFGRAHVDMILDTFARIQSELFASTGGSVASTLKQMILQRFNVSVPEGYLYFPMSMGGLDLKNPFVGLGLVRNTVSENPDQHMDRFFSKEEETFRLAQSWLENHTYRNDRSFANFDVDFEKEPYTWEEFCQDREQTSEDLANAYEQLLSQPGDASWTSDAPGVLLNSTFAHKSNYQRWIIQLYAQNMISRFGGLEVVEKGLLPAGMVNMLRQSRFNWQG